MGLVWNPWAVPNLAAAVILLGVAVFTFLAAPGRRVNRWLAVVFLGYASGCAAAALLYSVDDQASAHAAQALIVVAFTSALLCYPIFLGHALDRAAPAFLRSPAFAGLALATAGGIAVAVLAWPESVAVGYFSTPYARFETIPGSSQGVMIALGFGVSLGGLLLSLRAFFKAPPGTPTRRKAGFFLAAFGVQDAGLVVQTAIVAAMPPGSLVWNVANVAGFSTVLAVASVLVAYGMVRYQLFDLDVRIKLGVRTSTVAAAFLAVFFVVAQFVEAYAGRFGTVAGALAAGLLLFALRPLQRAAERVADTAMPRVSGDQDYLAYRKIEVYRTTVEEVASDGVVTDDERRLLTRLAAKLDLGETAARAIERDVFAAKGVA